VNVHRLCCKNPLKEIDDTLDQRGNTLMSYFEIRWLVERCPNDTRVCLDNNILVYPTEFVDLNVSFSRLVQRNKSSATSFTC